MVFSSLTFLFYFLPCFLLVFYLTRFNKLVILIFSILFYAWGEPRYAPLMLTMIVLNYGLGLAIEKSRETRRGKSILAAGIVINLLPLLFFKYLDFLATTFGSVPYLPHYTLGLWQIALPLGISFYTFHSMSYLIDVYRGDCPAERRILDLAVYISMFPQLIAGPIIRFKTIADDIHHPIINFDRTAQGVRLFIIGLAQKVLIANTVAVPVDLVFGLPPSQLSTVDAWLGIIDYTLQIYFDFAGYSTMAIGLGLIMGLRFPQNFNYPYSAVSITDFWRRWHISLSLWFRDYVYIPLGGNRISQVITYRNLVVVFFLCGLWHGAAWTFVAWGLFHGGFLVAERAGLSRILEGLPHFVRRAYVLITVMIGWVLFRTDSFSHALIFLRAMAGFGAPYAMGPPAERLLHIDVELALIVGTVVAGVFSGRNGMNGSVELAQMPSIGWLRMASLMVILFAVSMTLASGAYNPFIYFRF